MRLHVSIHTTDQIIEHLTRAGYRIESARATVGGYEVSIESVAVLEDRSPYTNVTCSTVTLNEALQMCINALDLPEFHD